MASGALVGTSLLEQVQDLVRKEKQLLELKVIQRDRQLHELREQLEAQRAGAARAAPTPAPSIPADEVPDEALLAKAAAGTGQASSLPLPPDIVDLSNGRAPPELVGRLLQAAGTVGCVGASVSNAELSDAHVDIFAHALATKHLLRLSFSDNLGFSDAAARALAPLLQSSKHLLSIDLCGVPWQTPQARGQVLHALANCSNLRHLGVSLYDDLVTDAMGGAPRSSHPQHTLQPHADKRPPRPRSRGIRRTAKQPTTVQPKPTASSRSLRGKDHSGGTQDLLALVQAGRFPCLASLSLRGSRLSPRGIRRLFVPEAVQELAPPPAGSAAQHSTGTPATLAEGRAQRESERNYARLTHHAAFLGNLVHLDLSHCYIGPQGADVLTAALQAPDPHQGVCKVACGPKPTAEQARRMFWPLDSVLTARSFATDAQLPRELQGAASSTAGQDTELPAVPRLDTLPLWLSKEHARLVLLAPSLPVSVQSAVEGAATKSRRKRGRGKQPHTASASKEAQPSVETNVLIQHHGYILPALSSLESLSLRFCALSASHGGCQSLFAAAARHPRLHRLDISHNDISSSGIEFLCDELCSGNAAWGDLEGAAASAAQAVAEAAHNLATAEETATLPGLHAYSGWSASTPAVCLAGRPLAGHALGASVDNLAPYVLSGLRALLGTEQPGLAVLDVRGNPLGAGAVHSLLHCLDTLPSLVRIDGDGVEASACWRCYPADAAGQRATQQALLDGAAGAEDGNKSTTASPIATATSYSLRSPVLPDNKAFTAQLPTGRQAPAADTSIPPRPALGLSGPVLAARLPQQSRPRPAMTLCVPASRQPCKVWRLPTNLAAFSQKLWDSWPDVVHERKGLEMEVPAFPQVLAAFCSHALTLRHPSKSRMCSIRLPRVMEAQSIADVHSEPEYCPLLVSMPGQPPHPSPGFRIPRIVALQVRTCIEWEAAFTVSGTSLPFPGILPEKGITCFWTLSMEGPHGPIVLASGSHLHSHLDADVAAAASAIHQKQALASMKAVQGSHQQAALTVNEDGSEGAALAAWQNDQGRWFALLHAPGKAVVPRVHTPDGIPPRTPGQTLVWPHRCFCADIHAVHDTLSVGTDMAKGLRLVTAGGDDAHAAVGLCLDPGSKLLSPEPLDLSPGADISLGCSVMVDEAACTAAVETAAPGLLAELSTTGRCTPFQASVQVRSMAAVVRDCTGQVLQCEAISQDSVAMTPSAATVPLVSRL